MTRLSIKNLHLHLADKKLLDCFSHDFALGSITALTGHNGSGKTTLLKTLAGLLPVSANTVFIDGEDLININKTQRSKIISLLFQISPLQPYCLAKDRIAHGLMPIYGFDHILSYKEFSQVEDLARQLNIAHLLDRRLANMSGGEQRLVNLAKCLINQKLKLTLLDEPSVYLDFAQKKNLANLLIKHAQNGSVIIFSSHDLDFINQCAHGILDITHQKLSSLRSLANKAEIASLGETCSYNTR